MNVFVFDIETVPDVDGGRRAYGLKNLSDKDVANALFTKRQQENGTEFLRLHLQRIVAISAVFRHGDDLRIWSLGDEEASEKELIQRFFSGIEKYTPTLVSWNGGGFDLPVLHYRAMLHHINAAQYWDTGEGDAGFKWNNYINRYHTRHTDLMEVLAMFQARASVPLDQVATLLGYPGKMGMSGSHVWEAFQEGDIKGIRDYCETDVANTYLVYLRYLLMSGRFNETEFFEEEERVRAFVSEHSHHSHWNAFLEAWEALS